jgi:hypothetical protein
MGNIGSHVTLPRVVVDIKLGGGPQERPDDTETQCWQSSWFVLMEPQTSNEQNLTLLGEPPHGITFYGTTSFSRSNPRSAFNIRCRAVPICLGYSLRRGPVGFPVPRMLKEQLGKVHVC